MRICIITTNIGEAGFTPLLNLVKIFTKISEKVYAFTSEDFKEFVNKMELEGILQNLVVESIGKKKRETQYLFQILSHTILQLKICIKLILKNKHFDRIIFFIGGEKMVLPILVAKLLGKKTFLLMAGSETKVERTKTRYSWIFVDFASKLTKALVSKIIVYSPNLVKEWGLHPYISKIYYGYEHNLDLKLYEYKNLHSREYVGFIGRLSAEKGVINFLEAVKYINLQKRGFKYKFLVGGDGELKQFVIDYAKANRFLEYVGWIDKRDLVKYMNRMSLLVVPSHTEGLPNIVLEAMACKTPVLANAVGSIPDVISHHKTGYLIENNDPKTIAKEIADLMLNVADLKRVGHNAKELVGKKFNLEYVQKRWLKILS